MTRTRRMLMLPLVGILFFASCKKDDKPVDSTVKPEDPVALSKAIKVWHGERLAGNPPAANTGGPSAAVTSSQNIKAVSGRYAIIKPEIMSGNVAGYYVKVNGAQEFFKVDYSKPRDLGRLKMPVRKSVHNRALYKGMKIDSTGNGNLDSGIVITIPTSIQPGQFCITYYAYDPSGNTGNPVTVCVTVVAFGGDASFNGTWHITGQSYDTTMGWEPVYGLSDTIYSQATCVNGQVVDTFGSDPSIFQYPAFMFTITKADLVLGSNGGMKYELEETFKGFDYLQSTCSNYVYQTDSYSDVINGAWSFTPATNSMVLVFEFDDTGVPDPEAYEYTVKKINSNKFYLYDAVDDGWLRFEK